MEIARRDIVAMMTPIQFERTDFIKPAPPPPHAKNDAHAMKVTQTGIGRMVAVRYVSRQANTVMLIVSAINGGTIILQGWNYGS